MNLRECSSVTRISKRLAFLLLAVGAVGMAPIRAVEKLGMPDLAQIEQTCLPTSAGNLMIWFGHNGYPKLIASGDTEDDRDLHTVHEIMNDTDARFDWGTQQKAILSGIRKFVHEAGYEADVEYRGMDYGDSPGSPPEPLTEDWLKENDDPNKGFILLFSYCLYHPESNTYTNALGAGHAVTLVNMGPGFLLIHDPAHESSQTGRKIVTPRVLTSGSWQEGPIDAPVAGLMLVSGSLLEEPENSQVMLVGAVCITMHPPNAPKSNVADGGAGLSGKSIAGTSSPSTTPGATPAKPDSAGRSWWMWMFDLFFKK